MENKKLNNPSAFPQTDYSNIQDAEFKGMTLRDYFAGKALQGHLASEYYAGTNTQKENLEGIASNMYAFADAMLKQREL